MVRFHPPEILVETAVINQLVPTPDERTMGTLAHVLQLVGGFIAPLIIFLIKRDSRFVSFHALQALLLQALYFFSRDANDGRNFCCRHCGCCVSPAGSGEQFASPGICGPFPLVWLGMMGWWVFILVVAIVYGIKAGRGEWAEYPVLGRLAADF